MFDMQPKSTPGGPFVLLCELVLTAVGMDSTGVEQAAARALKRFKSV
jgi:hypothetical protein